MHLRRSQERSNFLKITHFHSKLLSQSNNPNSFIYQTSTIDSFTQQQQKKYTFFEKRTTFISEFSKLNSTSQINQNSTSKNPKKKKLLGTYPHSEFMRTRQRVIFIWIDNGVFANTHCVCLDVF